jgi:hypothetical protein
MPKRKTELDLVTYVTQDDVEVVIQRIPKEFRTRLRDVFISHRSRGVRWLGSVRIRGRRDIDLYAKLPPRLSLGRFLHRGHSAHMYAAPARGQWPPWAIRRYLLYQVFLHELGHLQLVDPATPNWKRKYAGQTRAQEFADEWRTTLWSSRCDHPDPIHNPPRPEEFSIIPLWQGLNKSQRYQLVTLALDAPHDEMPDLAPFGEIDSKQTRFLSRALCHH